MKKIKSLDWFALAFHLSRLLLILMAVPGTHVFRIDRGAEASGIIMGSYILGSWTLMTYINFAAAAVGLLSAWMAKKWRNRPMALVTILVTGGALYMKLGLWRVQDMAFEYPLMFGPPILAVLTILTSGAAILLPGQNMDDA